MRVKKEITKICNKFSVKVNLVVKFLGKKITLITILYLQK